MTEPEETEDTLKHKLDQWLHTEGFPLEFRTANIFRQGGLKVNQGYYVSDRTTGSPREIDVLAAANLRPDHCLVRLSHVVECKWSADKPWLVFSSTSSHIAPSACIAQSIGSEVAEAILWALAGDVELQSLDCFLTPVRPGFGGRQAFVKGNDLFYNAMQSATTLSYALAHEHDGQKQASSPDFIHVVFPLIVLEGKLFEVYYKSDTNQITIEERERIRLHWRGAEAHRFHSTIDIVTIDYLPTFVSIRSNEINTLLFKMADYADYLKECISKGSLEPLPVKNGSRGYIGLPSYLAKLKRQFISSHKTEGITAKDGDRPCTDT